MHHNYTDIHKCSGPPYKPALFCPGPENTPPPLCITICHSKSITLHLIAPANIPVHDVLHIIYKYILQVLSNTAGTDFDHSKGVSSP